MKPTIAHLDGTAYRNISTTGRARALQALVTLRREQSCGMSLKKARRLGLVTISWSVSDECLVVLTTPKGDRYKKNWVR